MNKPEPERFFAEDDLLPVSALADLVFCQRRAALHHIEGIWNDNVFTVEGTFLHNKTHDESPTETRGDLRIARGLRLRSLRLGLSGKADVVEFHRVAESSLSIDPLQQSTKTGGVVLPGISGLWQLFPVEYKRGRLRREEGYEIQLCAQALCLEEMLKAEVYAGAVYYGRPRRRLDVTFSAELRAETEDAVARLHRLVRGGKTPIARYEKKCDSCSMIHLCLPKTTGSRRSVGHYLSQAFKDVGVGEKE